MAGRWVNDRTVALYSVVCVDVCDWNEWPTDNDSNKAVCSVEA